MFEPQPFLLIRAHQRPVSRYRHDAATREPGLRGPLLGQQPFQLGNLVVEHGFGFIGRFGAGFVDAAGELVQRLAGEHVTGRQARVEMVPNAGHELGDVQGVPAQVEEAGASADPADSEDLLPGVGQPALRRSPGSDVLSRR